MRPILNYTTSISVQKTIGEIQETLSLHGNIQVLVEYEMGTPSAISFRVNTAHGVLSFLLPAKIDSVFRVIERSKMPKSKKTRDQAARVAWRIIKDWIEAQMALIQSSQATIQEVFLPFVQSGNGKTLYSITEEGGFKGLALPEPKGN